MFRICRALLVLSAILIFIVPTTGLAQPAYEPEENEVVVIPYSQRNPDLPHPAYKGMRMTLKGVIRNATCGDYDVVWDTNRDGVYDDYTRRVGRNGQANQVRDIGINYLVPTNFNRDSSLNLNVRVRNRCTQEDKFATMRLFVYNFEPSNDARNWTDEQLEVMSQASIQEHLWYIHRTLSGINNSDTNLYGNDPYEAASGLSLWVYTINGHLPAYPPQHMGQLNAGWLNQMGEFMQDNIERWHVDPYAETAMRLTQYLSGAGNTRGIEGGQENSNCGFNLGGGETFCNRLDGGGDGQGATAGSTNVYRLGIHLGGLATVLPALAGTPVHRGGGGIRNQSWEWYIQQMTDQLGANQIDCGCGHGGWYYDTYNGCAGCGTMDASTAQWGYIGLESAEVAGKPYGVMVANNHKYSIANNLINNQRGDGGAAYRSNFGRSDFKLTGGALVGARWLGIHQMDPNSNANPFPGYSDYVEGGLRHSYDRYVQHLADEWNCANCRGSHWTDSQWQNGDYLCGNSNGVHPHYRCGVTYTMYSLQKGFRTGRPELLRVGGHDWVREYNTYYLRAQDRHYSDGNPMHNYNVNGRLYDEYCGNHSVTCHGRERLAQPMGGLTITPAIFNPKPVAIASVRPNRVTEGCAGGNSGVVEFDHDESFHPNADSWIAAYQWDVDADDGLWWETNDQPDFQTPDVDDNYLPSFEFRYPRSGNFTATLRIVDNIGQIKTTTVSVRVDPAQNVPPAAAHGGPYRMEVGTALELDGRASDVNIDCGDDLNVTWDLNNDGNFNDAEGERPTVLWAAVNALGLEAGVPHSVTMRVTDSQGATDEASTTLTIYPQEPVAVARANPNPAACQQNVRFDGGGSFHANPDRTIAQYEWNVDGNAGFDGGGAIFTYAYAAFGQYDVVLRVTDDMGRTDQTQLTVDVSSGNAAPIARVAENEFALFEGDNLALDARGSSDPNEPCGDSITEYAWDINGDGDFEDAVDIVGANAQVEVPWATLDEVMDWPADRNTGLPTNTITLRVKDSFGAEALTATTDIIVTIFRARPVAEASQRPDPGMIRRGNGFSQVSLDGGESYSPVPGVSITGFEWVHRAEKIPPNQDTEADEEGQVFNFQHVFNPVPGPENIPVVSVYLRVTDSTGRASLWTRYDPNYDVPPTHPTADADPTDPPERGYHILLGDDLTVDGSQSVDPDDDDYVRYYRWDLSYDEDEGFVAARELDDENNDGVEASTTFTAAELTEAGVTGVGTYTIRLEVEDNFNQSNTDEADLNVYARDPLVAIEANPNPTSCGGRVTLDGSDSDHPHPDITIAAHRWDLDGDGEFDDAVGDVVNHRFTAFTFGDDRATVGLQVVDSIGGTASMTVQIQVDQGNRAPAPVAGGFRNDQGEVVGSYAIGVGEDIRLDAEGTTDPDTECGDAVVSYQWDIGNDGVADVAGTTVDLTWAQLQAYVDGAGSYDIRLIVTDRWGATAEDLVTLIVAAGPNAVAEANPNRTGCENQVVFSAERSTTDGPAGQGFDLVSYEWDLDGDGEFDDAEGARFVRAAVGLPGVDGRIEMSAAVRVTDDSGRSDTADVNVVIDVQNQPPVADAGGPYFTGPLNDQGDFAPVRLDGRSSTDPNAPCDQVVRYRWDTDDDNSYGSDDPDEPAENLAVVPAFTNGAWQVNTVQTIRLIVCDGVGACSDPAEADVAVRDEAPPSGEIISPRADGDVCIGAGDEFEVVVNVADPVGQEVEVSVVIDNVVVADMIVDTPDDGSFVEVRLPVNAEELNGDGQPLVREGRHTVMVDLIDINGGEATVDSGGRITFDRTAPVVEIGNRLGEGVCYTPNQVRDPDVEVEDNFDPAPTFNQETEEDGCGRTLVVTATDRCGNQGEGRRSYLIAEQVDLVLDGVDEGALVASATLNWTVVGPNACAVNIQALLARAGEANPQPYAEGTVIDDPGSYAMSITVSNCNGVPRTVIRSFTVNAPPVAVPVPAGHPDEDPDNPGEYRVVEGAGLQLDASESRAPEATDSVASYAWDIDGNGSYDDDIDAEGSLAAFPTDEDGVFTPTLRVSDSLGASNEEQFTVRVIDVDPLPNAGGPYLATQGVEITLDGSGSQAGSVADLISNYRWDFGDNTPEAQGAALAQAPHTFENHGVFNVTLTVDDEDSSAITEVRVEVRDVDPIVDSVDQPAEIYEIRPMAFQVNATPGAPGDPITRIEWDMENDQEVDYAGQGLIAIDHQFHVAGDYNVLITVFDGDSETIHVQAVTVAEATLAQLVAYTNEVVEEQIANDDHAPRDRVPLVQAQPHLEKAAWGERHTYRGNTYNALVKGIEGLVDAQENGIGFGLELWALSRQALREVTRLRARIIADNPGLAQVGSMVKADEYIGLVDAAFNNPDFKQDVGSEQRGFIALDLMRDAREAFFWLEDTISPCNQWDRFPVPQGRSPEEISAMAEPINANAHTAMVAMWAEMDEYTSTGMQNNDGGPGRAEIMEGMQTMEGINDMVQLPITNPCPDNTRCISDTEALEMELDAMELVKGLNEAAGRGVWVRNWQACLTNVLKFRVELSILRVESQCGRNVAIAQRARAVQAVGLDMIEAGDYVDALNYYQHDDRRCLMIEVFNECLVPTVWLDDEDGNRFRMDAYPTPEICQPEDEEAEEEEEEEDEEATPRFIDGFAGDNGPDYSADGWTQCLGIRDQQVQADFGADWWASCSINQLGGAPITAARVACGPAPGNANYVDLNANYFFEPVDNERTDNAVTAGNFAYDDTPGSENSYIMYEPGEGWHINNAVQCRNDAQRNLHIEAGGNCNGYEAMNCFGMGNQGDRSVWIYVRTEQVQ